MIGSGRHEARERALSLLYEAESKDLGTAAVIEALPVAPEPFVLSLLTAVEAQRPDIDRIIEEHAVGWALDRMPVIDRNVLRLAVAELLDHDGPPVGVVINEAVELAKRYSTDESGRFVNGVLAAVAGAIRPG